MSGNRSELSAFLRSRRDRLTPGQAGMQPFPGPRRVPGLRREELAVLAGLSPDYYSRVEQGRQANVSVEVLNALARALRLDEVERAHLAELAAPARRSSAHPEPAQRADPGLLRVMTALDHLPVVLLGLRGEILASNHLLRSVLGRELPPGSSFIRFLFLDPLARERILNWPHFARASVGALRRELGRRPYDRRLAALIAELRADDTEFGPWWDDQGVRDYASVAKQILHPAAGELRFDIEIVGSPQDPEQRLVIYTAEPHSRTLEMLPLLASWNPAPSDRPDATAHAVAG